MIDGLTLVLVLIGLGLIVWGVQRMAKHGDTLAGIFLLIAGAVCLVWPFW